LRGCFSFAGALESGLALESCLRGEGGLTTGTGFGIAEPTTSRTPWAAGFIGLSIRQLSVSSLGAWLAVEGGVPFVRAKYVIEDYGTIFRAAPVVARVSFGLAWSFR
jgi:hypothetical protein